MGNPDELEGELGLRRNLKYYQIEGELKLYHRNWQQYRAQSRSIEIGQQ